jgi:DNA-directed RNA polymerase subunit RPC12/RpoP
MMQTQSAYCSACDQDVRVVITDSPVHADQAPIADAEVVCLDFGERCTGSLCPMFGLPRMLMGVRLARSGLRPEAFQTVQAPCQDCGEVVDLQILDGAYVHCPACGSRNRWVRLKVGDEDYVALASAGNGD